MQVFFRDFFGICADSNAEADISAALRVGWLFIRHHSIQMVGKGLRKKMWYIYV